MNLKTSNSIKYWAEEDRPREKMVRLGRHNLTNAELLAILLKTGTQENSALDIAKQVMRSYDENLTNLGKVQLDELTTFRGIGQTKAITILAAIELGRRRQQSEASKNTLINKSQSCYDLLGPQLADLPHEEFWIILLNRANRVLTKECVSRGGISGTLVDAKIIFRRALASSASGVVLMHNHPSGNPKPSEMDIRLTRRLSQAGKLLDIKVWDHLIIAGEGYTSFMDEGLMTF
ncbi:MAG: DNA repair protein RadC [Saprospiraceae bacterium]|nr:DNA repair protein RadC [Saprospiraceae bacterium]